MSTFKACPTVVEETHSIAATVKMSPSRGKPIGNEAGDTALGPAMLGKLFNHLTKLISECLKSVQAVNLDTQAQLSSRAYA
jgi:hypothetical protein